MPYSYITYLQARQALAQRLYDIPMHFQQDNGELGMYIIEALQTFNAYAGFYRTEFVFPTAFNQTWYDISSDNIVPNGIGPRPFTTSDLQIIEQIEIHLLEPVTAARPLLWAGTLQFNFNDLFNALTQARDQTLSESGCTVNQSLIPAVPGRTFLDETVMEVRRVCWIPNTFQSDFTINCLLPSDLWATQSFNAGFPQKGNGTPLVFRRSTEPPVSFDVDIQPAVTGQYDILTTNTYGPLSAADPSNTIINVPDDWHHVVKYGALAQLFGREDLAKDVLRADYCSNRYKQGVAFMQTAPAVLAARVNNVPVIVDSMSNGDFYKANWQYGLLAEPQYLFYSGLNMLGAAPVPDAVYSITASVVANMPRPNKDGDFLQIGRDDINAILDCAQHIAMLKVGGEEFSRTYPLYKNFLRHCALYNSKLKASSQWLEWLDRRQEEIKVNPIFQQPDPVTVDQGATGTYQQLQWLQGSRGGG